MSLKAAPGSSQVKRLLLLSSSGLLPVRVLPLEIKVPMTYQPKWVYLGVAENFNPGQASQSKTIGKSNKGEKHYFTEKKEVRMGCCENGLVERRKSSA